jgi:penicillin-binding protein 2
LRYEIASRGYTSYKSVILAKEISENSMLEIEERNNEFSGINISKYPKRKYLAGNTASHILGYTGPISSDEYKIKKELGYSQNDIIGKSGVEATFEDFLRGEDGKSRLEMDSKGRITGAEEVTESQMGDSIVLTIDLDLQKKAEAVLEKYIKQIQNGGFSEKFADAKAGSLVVLDVDTSEVLAMASYPSYNPSEFTDGISNTEYAKYFSNEDKPMFNRAIQGAYSPGSTFKMVTAIAGLESRCSGNKRNYL